MCISMTWKSSAIKKKYFFFYRYSVRSYLNSDLPVFSLSFIGNLLMESELSLSLSGIALLFVQHSFSNDNIRGEQLNAV